MWGLKTEPFTFVKGTEGEGSLDCAAGDGFGGLETFEGSFDAIEGEEKVCCSGTDAACGGLVGEMRGGRDLLGGLRLRRRC
jgi:hypothetical protein